MFAIIRSLFVVAVAVAAVSAGTYSYFSASDISTGNTLSAGTLTVNVENQNAPGDLSFAVGGLAPGNTTLVNFDVQNGGTAGLPVNLRGFASGEWATPGDMVSPDNSLVQVVKVERWNGAAWETIMGDGAEPITGMFYYSPTGADAALYTIAAGDQAQFQLTVKLDELAGDQYQDEAYNASVTVQTKQSTAPSWPADLSGF